MSRIDESNNHKIAERKKGLYLLFILLMAGPPFVFELMPGMPGWVILLLIIYPFFIIYSIRHKISFAHKKHQNIVIFWLFIWVFYAIIHLDSVYLSRCLVAIISYTIISFIIQLGVDVFCKYYIYLMLVFSLLGALSFILFYLGGIHPLFEYTNADGRPGYCFGITCSNVYSTALNIFRYSGFFDEPGAMGLWGLIAILLNRLVLKNKVVEAILIVCLLFTFSIGYIISVFIYLLFFSFNIKHIKALIPISLLLAGCLIFISKDDDLRGLVFGRMQYNESSGTLAGNNRAEQQDNAKRVFKEYPLFGIGASAAVKLGENGYSVNENILSPFAKDGVVGVIALYFPFIMTFWRNRKEKDAVKCLLVFSLTFMHRPIVVNIFDITMYLVLLDVITKYGKNEVRKIKNNILCSYQ